MSDNSAQSYWKGNLRIVLSLLSIWFFISFVCGILLVDVLDNIRIGGFKLGFWIAQPQFEFSTAIGHVPNYAIDGVDILPTPSCDLLTDLTPIPPQEGGGGGLLPIALLVREEPAQIAVVDVRGLIPVGGLPLFIVFSQGVAQGT